MFPAFLATLFFALNATFATRSIRLIGMLKTNILRLVIGTTVLGAFAHTYGGGFRSSGTFWFLVSGVVGLGIGDLGTYGAFPLLGSRLTVLMVQCLAAPLAAFGEWLWLGTRLSAEQMLWGSVILAGVAVALLPAGADAHRGRISAMGLFYGFLGACGQGLGAALLSRKGVMVAAAAGEGVRRVTFGLTVAYERLLAGLVFTLSWFCLLRILGRLPKGPEAGRAGALKGYGWTLANGLAGPVAAVSCYQWALATAPSGIVLPIAATTPLVSIPVAYWIEGDRPSARSVVGGLVAVVGCVMLARAA